MTVAELTMRLRDLDGDLPVVVAIEDGATPIEGTVTAVYASANDTGPVAVIDARQ